MPLNQQVVGEQTTQTGLPDLDYQREIGLLLPNGDKEENVCNNRIM